MAIGSDNGRIGTSSVIHDKFDGALATVETREPDTVNQSGTAWAVGSSSAGLSVDGNGALSETTSRTYHDVEVNAKTPNRAVKTLISSSGAGGNIGVHMRGTTPGDEYDYIYASPLTVSTVNILAKNYAGSSLGTSGSFSHALSTPTWLIVEDDGTDYTIYMEDVDGNVISGSSFTVTASAARVDNTYYGLYADGDTDEITWYDFQVI